MEEIRSHTSSPCHPRAIPRRMQHAEGGSNFKGQKPLLELDTEIEAQRHCIPLAAF